MPTLELDARADEAAIKARYKELVKRHHPDANGGDRSSEDKLREIIQAYNYLQIEQAGLKLSAGSLGRAACFSPMGAPDLSPQGGMSL